MRKTAASLAVVIIGLLLGLGAFTAHSYVTTPSMYPTIPPGSMVFVHADADPHVGQVIVFRANGLTWAHRLIEIKANGDYVTKGDNPENVPDFFDPAVTKTSVIGDIYLAPKWLGFPELIAHHPGYGLAWLRAELGTRVRILVLAAIAALAWLPIRREDATVRAA
jgi:signal peptidase I